MIRRGLQLVAVSCVLVLAAGAAAWLWLRASLPPAPRDYPVAGVEGPVSIRYDARRRPYVSARTFSDALFAEGWLHARERLWQMELLRRAGRGRLAAGLGRGMLDADASLWRAGVPQLAAALAGNASPVMLARVDAYVAGINAALDASPHLPPEFTAAGLPRPRWTAEDVFGVAALIAFQSAGNMENEMLRLVLAGVLEAEMFAAFLPEEAARRDFPFVLTRRARNAGAGAVLAALDSLTAPLMPNASLGSSSWVVAGFRSDTGAPLFAFDSHDDLSLPNLFYEVHLFFDGSRQVRGWSVPGLPGVINGYNETVAWGLTNIGDTQDLFVEEVSPEDPDAFRGPAGWYPAREQRVALAVAGQAEPEILTIRFSCHGPIVHDDPPLALRWTGHDVQGLGMDAFLELNLARDAQALELALDRLPLPTTNVTYADVHGVIGFRTAGLLPVRRSGRGLVPRSGADPDSGWDGYVPAFAMPRSQDPGSGFLAAANARVAADGPLVSADNAPGYRMRRLRDVLQPPGTLTLDDMQRLQLDWYNPQAAGLLPGLLAAIEAASLDPLAARARQVLTAWQQTPLNEPGAAGAAIFEHWYLALADEVFGHRLPPALVERVKSRNYLLNHALDRILLDAGSPWWSGRYRERVRLAFEAAVAALAERFGDDPESWHWGRVQRILWRHELAAEIPVAGALLDRGPYPWGGSPATLGRARFSYARPFLARSGATVRVVAELASPMRVRAIMPGGQSGHPSSPHYDDQLGDWLRGRLDALPSDPSAVTGPQDRLVPSRMPGG